MKVKITYDKEKLEKELELDSAATVKDALNKVNINPVTVIVSRDNTIIMEDEQLNDGDELRIMSVISGG